MPQVVPQKLHIHGKGWGWGWLTVANEAQRVRAESWLAQVRPRTAGLSFSISETLLVARKA